MSQLFIMPLFGMLNMHSKVKGYDTILDNDPYGVTVTLISVSVVLSALIVLALLIWLFSRAMIYVAKRQSKISLRKSQRASKGLIHDLDVEDHGEIIAAIALAVKLNKEALHDKESEVITLNTVARAYSPWSSKIHGLTKLPR